MSREFATGVGQCKSNASMRVPQPGLAATKDRMAFGLLCHLNHTGAQPADTRRHPVVPRRLFAVPGFSRSKTRADSTCVSKICGCSETRPPPDATRSDADEFKSRKSIVTIISFRVENICRRVHFA